MKRTAYALVLVMIRKDDLDRIIVSMLCYQSTKFLKLSFSLSSIFRIFFLYRHIPGLSSRFLVLDYFRN